MEIERFKATKSAIDRESELKNERQGTSLHYALNGHGELANMCILFRRVPLRTPSVCLLAGHTYAWPATGWAGSRENGRGRWV